MSQAGTCCTCASFLSDTKIPRDPKSEKPLAFDRRLDCCQRRICALCQYKNPRFQTYCPFCQISSEPTALPQNGLRLPPAYSKTLTSKSNNTQRPETSLRTQIATEEEDEIPPPPYTPSSTATHTTSSRLATPLTPSSSSSQTHTPTNNDTIHHLSPSDTLPSLSLAYGLPISVLQSHNNLFSSHLLAARKIILIPASHYQGPSLSTPPDPVEEARKRRIRRWMVATKCPDYRVAEVYLKGVVEQPQPPSQQPHRSGSGGSDGDGDGGGGVNAGEEDETEDKALKAAIERYKADEEWERRNPLEHRGKGAMEGGGVGKRRRGAGGSLSGQLF